MWRQTVAGLIGVMLSWAPTQGLPGTTVHGKGHPVSVGAVRTGKEAVFLALEQITQALTDVYYHKYGGLLVTRRSVEERVRKKMEEKQNQIARLLKEEYHCDDVPIRFNPATSEVTYSASHGLRTVTIREIVDSIVQFSEKLQENR